MTPSARNRSRRNSIRWPAARAAASGNRRARVRSASSRGSGAISSGACSSASRAANSGSASSSGRRRTAQSVSRRSRPSGLEAVGFRQNDQRAFRQARAPREIVDGAVSASARGNEIVRPRFAEAARSAGSRDAAPTAIVRTLPACCPSGWSSRRRDAPRRRARAHRARFRPAHRSPSAANSAARRRTPPDGTS